MDLLPFKLLRVSVQPRLRSTDPEVGLLHKHANNLFCWKHSFYFELQYLECIAGRAVTSGTPYTANALKAKQRKMSI